MSRVAKSPVVLPAGVSMQIKGQIVEVSNSNHTLSHTVHQDVAINQGETGVHFSPVKGIDNWALAGTSRALVANMVTGLSTGYTVVLELFGVGYRVKQEGQKLIFNLGYSHPVEFVLPDMVTASIEKQLELTLKSVDKHLLGQVSANIVRLRKPDAYKGKGVRTKKGLKRLVQLKLKEVKKK